MSRADLFEKAKLQRAEEKQKQVDHGASWSGIEYEGATYMALQTDGQRVFRIIGSPLSDRQNCYDPKKANIAMILGDNGTKFRCIFPDHQENPDWILWKIYDLVLAGKYEGSGAVKTKVFFNENTHPECFNRVKWNDNPNKYEKGWTPKTTVLMNVIDRQDAAWHKANKHTKLLSSKASESKTEPGKFYYEPGIPVSCYNTIWDEVVEYAGDWADYDVVVKKMGVDPWYKAYHAVDDSKKLADSVKKYVVDGNLTSEELAYEQYDLDQMFAVTTYTKIKAKLEKFIKKVDTDFGKNFSEELDRLVVAEQAKWKAEGKNQYGFAPKAEKPVFGITPATEAEESIDIPESEVAVRPKRASVVEVPAGVDWEGLADGTFNGTKYIGVPEMTDEEKAVVLGVNENGSFIYNCPKKECLRNENSKFEAPGFYHIDPLTGELF